MAVFYNSETGQYDQESQSLNPITESAFLANEARLHTGTGWHEYGSIAAMNAAIKKNGWPSPTQNNNPATAAAKGAAGVGTQAAAKAIPGVGSIDDAIHWLSQPALWERAAEILGGFILLYIGIKAVTGYEGVTKTAAKAGKVALLK